MPPSVPQPACPARQDLNKGHSHLKSLGANIRIMEKKMETTIMGYTGFRGLGFGD